jgi:phenylalanine-4-hydroxylase
MLRRFYCQRGAFTLFPPDGAAKNNRKSVGVAFDLEDTVGSLVDALSVFSKHGLNLTNIQNRASPLAPHHQMFYVHLLGKWEDPAVQDCLKELRACCVKSRMYRVAAPVVPWFPRKMADLDQFSRITLDAGEELQSDHPGFTDEAYRRRRQEIAQLSKDYRSGQPVPTVDYTETEKNTWETVWDKLTSLYPSLACKEYNEALGELKDAGIYGPRKIPQLEEMNEFVSKKTGFIFRPVTGLLSGRDFLNALAFRVFFSTQYIRHHSVPMYTPEPDIVHELMGHAPMFLNPDFADFTQYIGLASLGATDEEIKRLAACYWFSVEFGLLFEGGDLKAYGAGLLSSFGELQHSTSPTNPNITIRDWIPSEAAVQDYPITTMQPVYFAASSMKGVKEHMKDYCDKIKRPFNCIFDETTKSVYTDVDVYTKPVGLKFKPVGDNEEWKIVS